MLKYMNNLVLSSDVPSKVDFKSSISRKQEKFTVLRNQRVHLKGHLISKKTILRIQNILVGRLEQKYG